LLRGKIDLAFLRHEKNAPGIVFTRLIDEPLIVLMPADHRLTIGDAITSDDIAGEQLVGIPMEKSPALRAVIDAYGAMLGIDLTPDHALDNLSMAVSLVASTGGISLTPVYARNLLPPTDTSRRCTDDRFFGALSGRSRPADASYSLPPVRTGTADAEADLRHLIWAKF